VAINAFDEPKPRVKGIVGYTGEGQVATAVLQLLSRLAYIRPCKMMKALLHPTIYGICASTTAHRKLLTQQAGRPVTDKYS
jgi:hypothetical protein